MESEREKGRVVVLQPGASYRLANAGFNPKPNR